MDFEKMREVIAETAGCDLEDVTREAKLEEDLGLDSLAAMELVMALEDASGLKIDDSELDNFKTVADLADYLDKQVE